MEAKTEVYGAGNFGPAVQHGFDASEGGTQPSIFQFGVDATSKEAEGSKNVTSP